LTRHALVDRLFHWLAGGSVLLLLATSLLPVLGLEFAWVTVHWITGLILAILVLAHSVRAVCYQDLASMWISGKDLKRGLRDLGLGGKGPDRAAMIVGKYSLAQKAIHHAFSIVLLTAVVTGLLMLVRIDAPFWNRNPYWLSGGTWGVIYTLHGLASLLLVTMIIMHVYFALRPEKLYLTRSMIVGWIRGEEYEKYYDPSGWPLESNRDGDR
jgi:cytochrome b subunit of formate dehydrogenase